jgi:hypothetical protein
MASTYIYRDYNSAPTNGNKATFSMWVKRGAISSGSRQKLIGAYDGGSAGQYIEFNTDDTIRYHSGSGGAASSTNAKFRDAFGWYHIVVQHDTTGSGTSDQVKIYVNGELQSMANNYGASVASQFGKNSVKAVLGAEESSYSSQYYDGLISHFHFIDGTIYAPTVFGSTDSTTGEWKINTSPSVTYGTNGCFLFKDDNSLNDDSTNSNNFTLGNGTFTKTEDNPSNVFATMNALSAGSDMTFGNGNTKIRNDVGTWNSGVSTIAPATGKYYWEVYVHGGGDNNTGVTLSSAYGGTHSEVDAGRVVYSRNGYIYREGLSGQSNYATGVTYGDGDYIGVAFDTENGTLSFYKNGSAVSNSTTTDTSFLRTNNEYIVQCGLYNGGEFRFNFGNGAFGSTQLTGTTYQGDGNIGIFKYQPPTGYTALSTKGLNE